MLKFTFPDNPLVLSGLRRSYKIELPDMAAFGFALKLFTPTVKQYVMIFRQGVFTLFTADGKVFLRTPLKMIPSDPANYFKASPLLKHVFMKGFRAEIQFLDYPSSDEEDGSVAVKWDDFPGQTRLQLIVIHATSVPAEKK